jgi:hypothetical protein
MKRIMLALFVILLVLAPGVGEAGKRNNKPHDKRDREQTRIRPPGKLADLTNQANYPPANWVRVEYYGAQDFADAELSVVNELNRVKQEQGFSRMPFYYLVDYPQAPCRNQPFPPLARVIQVCTTPDLGCYWSSIENRWICPSGLTWSDPVNRRARTEVEYTPAVHAALRDTWCHEKVHAVTNALHQYPADRTQSCMDGDLDHFGPLDIAHMRWWYL